MITLLWNYLNGPGLFNRIAFGAFGLASIGAILLLVFQGVTPLLAFALTLAPLVLVISLLAALAKRSSKFRTRSTFRPLP